MIYGIGVDIVRIARIEAALERFGNRFAHRVLSDNELLQFAESTRPANLVAKHFAAKEAFVKALGTGIRDGLNWREIEVRHDPLGRPYLHISGRASEMQTERAVGDSHLSLSDENEYALAFVTLLKA